MSKKTTKGTSTRKQKLAEKKMTDAWQAHVEEGEEQKAVPYAMNKTFNTGQKIKHDTFGVGFVQELVGVNKMRVLFEGEEKLLVRAE